jgi:hypothetical protein
MTPSELNRIEGNIAELKKASTIEIADTAGNFTATNVEGALQELAGNVKNGKTAIANAIVAMGQTASSNDTFDALASKIRNISKDATAGTGDVLSGKTFYAGGAKKTGTMPNRGAVVITPGTQNQAIPAGYHNGQGYVKGDANLKPENIRQGVSIFGVAGSYCTTVASDTLRLSADTERSTNSMSFIKVKEIRVGRTGIYRVSYELRSPSGIAAIGRIYRNGLPYGSERTVSGGSYSKFTEDLFFRAGDLVQLYIRSGDYLTTIFTRNFRIYYDLDAAVSTDAVLQD